MPLPPQAVGDGVGVPAPRPSGKGVRRLRAATLIAASGGVLLWMAWRRARAVAIGATADAGMAACVVVPGYRLFNGDIGRFYACRLQRALWLWRCRGDRTLLISGAAANAMAPSEAHAGLCHLTDLGLPHHARVLLDTDARSTLHNLENARDLLGAHALDGVVVVSNRFHLARIGLTLDALSLPWRLCAAEDRWPRRVADAIALLREAVALLGFAGVAGARFDVAPVLARFDRCDVPRDHVLRERSHA